MACSSHVHCAHQLLALVSHWVDLPHAEVGLSVLEGALVVLMHGQYIGAGQGLVDVAIAGIGCLLRGKLNGALLLSRGEIGDFSLRAGSAHCAAHFEVGARARLHRQAHHLLDGLDLGQLLALALAMLQQLGHWRYNSLL